MNRFLPLLVVSFLCPHVALAQNAVPLDDRAPARMQSLEMITPQQEAEWLRQRDEKNTPAKDNGADITPSKDASPEQRLTVTPDDTATPPVPVKKDDKKDQGKGDAKPATLTPSQDLKAWSVRPSLYTALADPTGNAAQKAIAAFEAEPQRAAPIDLLNLARLYAAKNDMPKAAQLFYAAQLRTRFDYLRWPPTTGSNPYRAITADVAALEGQIGSWAMKSSKRFVDVIERARVWDEQTGYSYHPGHPLPDKNSKAPKEDAWPTLLDQARTAFFKDAGNMATALRSFAP